MICLPIQRAVDFMTKEYSKYGLTISFDAGTASSSNLSDRITASSHQGKHHPPITANPHQRTHPVIAT
jgi:hypothetical protein